MADYEDEIRALRDKLFGSTAGVSRGLIELLYSRGTSGGPATVFADYAKEEFVVYWLDGQLFRGLRWTGTQETASASELAYPLSTLSSVNAEYTLRYDDFANKHHRWDRKVTVQFPDEEPIVVDVRAEAMQDNDASRFVDAVLSALAHG